ncbi:putative metal-binding motif-containing protein [Patescibacteria group bacterium]|nr:putative metal-binding motif-containing protein [Patescibacteria group bacterium]MBU1683813.1 putative metal-binding motif-containing protein [Patescibacteria group bacterium]MBU1935133.1 putative metal-binding motif-containing protein [Patescibacteria group bacterium]
MAELVISVTILALIITTASAVYVNFFGSVRNLKAANLVYEEARFVMERIVKEVRNGTIDYEEYYNQSVIKQGYRDQGLPEDYYEAARNPSYALDYCKYSLQFYSEGPDGEIGTFDDESLGVRNTVDVDGDYLPPAIGYVEPDGDIVSSPIQNDLFLININGDRRSYVRRIEREGIGKIGLLKLVGHDFGVDNINASDPDLDPATADSCETDPGENDGRIDTWLCEDGFTCLDRAITNADASCTGITHDIIYNPGDPTENSYIDITPASLDIVDVKFIVSPMDDPRKAYSNNSVQIQPHVTIKLIARASPSIANQFTTGNTPDIVLESTVSARAYNEIITECNLKQCSEFSPPEPCLLTLGVCGPTDPANDPALQTCENFVWSGCTEETYQDYALSEWGNADFYQHTTEYASCDPTDPPETYDACRQSYCEDDHDNDCDGFTDEEDVDCQSILCDNGIYDGVDVEEVDNCIDVGGVCWQFHPYEEGEETLCFDEHDNDCDGNADEFDPDCIANVICQNGVQDSNFINFFDYTGPSTGYLVGYTTFDDDLNEEAEDVGGICETYADLTVDALMGDGYAEGIITGYDPDNPPATGERLVPDATFADHETGSLCYDGLDNDGDGFADELDGADTPSDLTDDDCLEVICNNAVQDCDLVRPDYSPANYLVGFIDTDSPPCSGLFNDEYCTDVGGVCDGLRDVVDLKYVDHTKISNENNPHSYTPPTPASNTCTDELDNDCDGDIDWEDGDCCIDGDNDSYVGDSETCEPPELTIIDCNDSDAAIHPGATEICDGVADEDCDGYADEDDFDCCDDGDGDNFGTVDAYLNCIGGYPNPPEPDCDDADVNIYPGAPENTEALCDNQIDANTPINDNCHTEVIDDPGNPGNDLTVERANHIDWYKATVGIATAFEYKYFEPACCDLYSVEICNDAGDSDENCDGLEGYDDHQCVTEDGSAFRDNFTSNSFIGATEFGATQIVGSGVITLELPTDVGMVTSDNINPLDPSTCGASDFRVSISKSDSTPGSSTIKYQLSNDGTTWYGDAGQGDWIEAGDLLEYTFTTSDYDIYWRAELEGDGSSSPSITYVNLTYNCVP